VVSYNATTFHDRDRRLQGVFAAARDVTELKRFEQTLQQKNLQLETASRAKSDFLSRMSHELRTPLNAILGFAQLLDLEAAQGDQQQSVKQILNGGSHLLELINEVLDIARIEAGHLAVSLEPVLIGEVIKKALDLVSPLASARGITLDHDPETSCSSYVLADRQRLTQILLNFLSNAVKYNREQGRVGVSCESIGGKRFRVAVTDTGMGIAQEDLALLFTPFERLSAERTSTKGTGLGLALSKGLAEAMGGIVGISSTVGRGTTFWVELAQCLAPAAG